MQTFISKITSIFKANANSVVAEGAKAYMRNQFDFLGIPALVRKKLTKQYLKENPLTDIKTVASIAKQLWQLSEREYQYFAIELLAFYKKKWNASIIELFEYCVTHKSWWDSVDFLITECIAPYFKQYPDAISEITSAWNKSNNIWLQRSSILFQKKYRSATNTQMLTCYILEHTASKEFFVQKAIGWALREYSYENESWVKDFVAQYPLAPLSKREALKAIERKAAKVNLD